MKKNIPLIALLFLFLSADAQLPDSCRLKFGTNLGGLADYGTEIPFVDLMKTSREWYTKSIGDPDAPFNSGQADYLTYRDDGYPTHVPQESDSSQYMQKVVTIWAITDGWPAGTYTVLWDGTGELSFWGGLSNLVQTEDGRLTFDFEEPVGSVIEMTIEESDINDPIHNIRVLMPGTESTYQDDPFYDLWIEKLSPFETVRFMDWGQTNNWGMENAYDYESEELTDWEDRSQTGHYTWAYNKGIPYESMVKLMNTLDIDGWVCIPHTASEDYVRNMARYFRDNLEDERHLYVEYSNEIWNWIFGQTHWANFHGCESTGGTWPECTVPYIQRTLDYWTEEYENDLDKITRVVGVQAGWLDVAERVTYNLEPESFDAVSPTYYFSFDGAADERFDSLANEVTVADIAQAVRDNMPTSLSYVEGVKSIADSLDKDLVFYEGGQHFTPHPFGAEPTYGNALLAIQRDTAMYNLYNEWFNKLRNLHGGDNSQAWLMMNFSFVSSRSARYGSWGILETMDQDTSDIPAPKYRAILDNMTGDCSGVTSNNEKQTHLNAVSIFPNPTDGELILENLPDQYEISIFDSNGRLVESFTGESVLNTNLSLPGIYYVRIFDSVSQNLEIKKIVVH